MTRLGWDVAIRCLEDAPEPALAEALAAFEEQFNYPLGPGRSFRISHGDDYGRFFRAIGDGRNFVALRRGAVLATLGVSIRTLILPDESRREAAYVGDLKVAPAARRSLIYARLALAAVGWGAARVYAAYGVVMDGTPLTPEQYTGRAAIPHFAAAGRMSVLRVPAGRASRVERSAIAAGSADAGENAFAALSGGRYRGVGGRPELRSGSPPAWLLHRQGSACGRIEDTRRAKRLIDADGVEMLSGHLARFAWRTPAAGAELIRAARGVAADRGFAALFTAVPADDCAAILAALDLPQTVVAPATVYAIGLLQPAPWIIDTSEI